MSSVEPKGVTPYRENDTEVQFEMHALIFFFCSQVAYSLGSDLYLSNWLSIYQKSHNLNISYPFQIFEF